MRKKIERISATKFDKEHGAAGDVGQGELYSPDHAIKIITNPYLSEKSGEDKPETTRKQKMVVAVNLRGLVNLAAVKEKVLEKLAAAAVPSEVLENARQFLEGVARDVATAAQGLTKDALHRIKTHLVDVLPSLSPAVTRKMVDDAEKEVNREAEPVEDEGGESKQASDNQLTGKSPYASPASSFFGSLAKPFSRL